MTNQILFATETIKTSQGWFEPGQLLPKEDLPELEVEALLDSKQAGRCAFDSPLAKFVHDARTMINKAQAGQLLKGALESVSAESPPSNEEPDERKADPTPAGYYPTLETYVAAGYKADNYETFKAGFVANKSEKIQREVDEKAAKIRAANRERS